MTSTQSAAATGAPSHIPAARIVDFDIFDEGMSRDVHGAWADLQRRAPDLFWTRKNGGHWMVVRAQLIRQVIEDHESWSAIQTALPLLPEPHGMLPLNLDPPANVPYRAMMMKHFTKQALGRMEDGIRDWTIELIERVADKGECEFVQAISAPFPITVFMQMMGLPLDHFDEFRRLALNFVGQLKDIEATQRNVAAINDVLKRIIAEKRVNPGEDMMSSFLSERIEGRLLTDQELLSMSLLLFIAGLDTVANAASFIFHDLARTPARQAELGAHPEKIEDYIEEAFRVYGVVSSARVARRDMTMDGVSIKAGEPILAALPLVGLDERANPNPGSFEIDRKNRNHMLFGGGAHLCVGNSLARMELRILIYEWLKRIPSFSLAPGYVPNCRPGQILGLANLDLRWSTAKA